MVSFINKLTLLTLLHWFSQYCRYVFNLLLRIRFTVILQLMAKAGHLLPDSQTPTTRTGCVTMVVGGMSNKLLQEEQQIHPLTLTWYHQPFGWSGVEILRSRAVMTPVTLPCYRPLVTVWLDKHSDQESQVLVTLETAKFGPVTSAWEAARFNMVVSTGQQTGFNRLSAVETSKAPTTSASGVTGVVVMDQWWWLVEEEVRVDVLITGLE